MSDNMVEDQAADWFDKKHFWPWTEAEEAAFNIWLAQSPAHEIAYWRLEAGWTRAERMAALKHPLRRTAKLPSKRFFLGVARAAAALAVLGVLGLSFGLPSKTQEATYSTPIGAHRVVRLADGSTIELNTNTRLKVLSGGKARQARLEKGEAFFNIKHDTAHPFVVLAAGRKVTDLGTKFILRLDGDKRLVMTLTEGRARLDATTADQVHRQATLEPGDVAIATDFALRLKKSAPRDVVRELGWREGKLIFDHTTLADAVAQFNRYNTQQLRIDDPAIAARTVSGTFRTTNTSDFASLARDVLGLKLERKQGVIVIAR
ncbi:MAG TPA: FecR domain-containing protein [Rhizomicrobium sp.]|nr:FecR domain-containing protein [Rhizomicrobium sp.]